MITDLKMPMHILDDAERNKRRAILEAAKKGDELAKFVLQRLYRLTRWETKEQGEILRSDK